MAWLKILKMIKELEMMIQMRLVFRKINSERITMVMKIMEAKETSIVWQEVKAFFIDNAEGLFILL